MLSKVSAASGCFVERSADMNRPWTVTRVANGLVRLHGRRFVYPQSVYLSHSRLSLESMRMTPCLLGICIAWGAMTTQSLSATNNAVDRASGLASDRASIAAMLEVQKCYEELAAAKCLEQVFRFELQKPVRTNTISRTIIRKDICELYGYLGMAMSDPSCESIRVICNVIRRDINLTS